jgi:hypothetical protein
MVLFGVHPPQTQVRNDTALHMDVVENFDGCCQRESNGWFHRLDDVGVNEKSPQRLG